ncbi:MAG: hypothetical protein WBP81_03870 [Solirubrobacteraceae bacterium]
MNPHLTIAMLYARQEDLLRATRRPHNADRPRWPRLTTRLHTLVRRSLHPADSSTRVPPVEHTHVGSQQQAEATA